MIKKMIASFIATLIAVMSLITFPVSAIVLPANITTDYVPAVRTGNFIEDTSVTDLFEKSWYSGGTRGAVSLSNGIWKTSETIDIPVSMNEGNGSYGVAGPSLNEKYFKSQVAKGKTIVFGATVRATKGTPQVKAAYSVSNDIAIQPKEYPDFQGGYPLSNEWTDIGNTFAINTKYFNTLCFGFAYTGIEGEGERTIEIQADSVYIGEEYAFDINVDAKDTNLNAEKSITIDADIVNQVGNVGGIKQGDFTWYALNSSRTALVDGFSVVKGENGTVTVAVDTSVSYGTYSIVAVSDTYDGFIRGIPVTVTAIPREDYVPDARTGNVLESGWTAAYNYNHSSLMLEGETVVGGDVSFSKASSGEGYIITSRRLLPDPNALYTKNSETGYHEWDGTSYSYSMPFSGGYLENLSWGNTAGKKTNIVFEFKVKGVADKGLPKINFGRVNKSLAGTVASRIEYPIEYSNKTIGYVPSGITKWESFSGTFASTSQNVNNYEYVIGLAQGTSNNSAAYISYDAYMGEEYLYDIRVASDKQQILAGESFTVDADIVNQVGNTSDFCQNVTWYAMDESRTVIVPGFNITEGSEGKAVVQTDSFVPKGTYTLVAIADIDKKFVKGVNVTVTTGVFADYVLGELKGNKAIPSAADGSQLLLATYVPFDLTSIATDNKGAENESWVFDTIEDIPESVAEVSGRGAAGAEFRKENYSADELLVAGKNIVIGATVRSMRGNPTIQTALYRRGSKPVYPAEYPNGLKLANSEWTQFGATLHIPETEWAGYRNTSVNFGFAYTGLVDECRRNIYVKKNSIYIGEEYAYDIQVYSKTKSCAFGETTSFTVDAQIVNQVGSKGYLDQSVQWYALNDERTEFVDGISIIENRSGSSSVTVTVSGNVPVGTYDIVAVSDVYKDLRKGISITVKNPFEDYVPGEITGNFIENVDVTKTDVFYPTWIIGGLNKVETVNVGTDDEAWKISATESVKDTVLGVNKSGVAGVGIDEVVYNAEKNLSAGKKIAIGARVKRTSSWYTPVIKTAMYHLQSTPTFPIEYPEASDGFKVSECNSWQDFGATIQIPEMEWYGHEHTILYLGFAYTGKTEGSRSFAVKKDSFYIGEEYAYDIKVTTDATEWKKGKSTAINLKASIINQVGTTGYLNQNVTWHVLDCTRTAEISGIEITERSDGGVTLAIDDSVPEGVYDVVAVSDAYENFVRGVRIKVVSDEELPERVSVFRLAENSGLATLSAAVIDTEAEEIFFAITSYNKDGKLTNCKILPVKVDDGVATVSRMYIDGIESETKVKGFIWENKTLRPIRFAQGVDNTVIIKQ